MIADAQPTYRLSHSFCFHAQDFGFRPSTTPRSTLNMDQSDSSLLQLAKDGDTASLEILFNRYLPRLTRLASKQLDPRLTKRIDVTDVIQEVMYEFSKRIHEYMQEQRIGLFQWLCFLTKQKVAEFERHHIHAQIRDVRREVPLHKYSAGNSSVALAAHLISQISSPSSVVGKEEISRMVHQAIEKLDADGREAIVLRHINQMKSDQAAELLGITQAAFRQRYFRALKQLKKILNASGLSW